MPKASRKVPVPGDEAPEVIVLGISTGGPEARNKVIPLLPANLAAPLFIVQHMPPLFTKSLADDLNQRSKLHVCEAVDGQVARRLLDRARRQANENGKNRTGTNRANHR